MSNEEMSFTSVIYMHTLKPFERQTANNEHETPLDPLPLSTTWPQPKVAHRPRNIYGVCSRAKNFYVPLISNTHRQVVL